jgi:predicted NAD-dependent protein-ADP-ribosyltransferase YbiA (DUF1768 family)
MPKPQSKHPASLATNAPDTRDLVRVASTDPSNSAAPLAASNSTGAIQSFTGEHAWLDNAYPAAVEMHGYVYPSLVNAYHAARTPRDKRHRFISLSPAEAQAEGLRLPQKQEFNRLQVPVMRMLLNSKFSLGTDLAVKLIATDDLVISYDNQVGDRFWGVSNGWGKDLLGMLLMLRRANLRIQILSATAPTTGVRMDPTHITDPQAAVPSSPFLMVQPVGPVHSSLQKSERGDGTRG